MTYTLKTRYMRRLLNRKSKNTNRTSWVKFLAKCIRSVTALSIASSSIFPAYAVKNVVQTFAGNGTRGIHDDPIQFDFPRGIAIDENDNLYVVNYAPASHAHASLGSLQKISPEGIAKTLLHGTSAEIPPTDSFLDQPRGVLIDSNDIYITMGHNNNTNRYLGNAIVKVTNGINLEEWESQVDEDSPVSIFAGQSLGGYANGIGTNAKFTLPTKMVKYNGKFLVSDQGNGCIRAIMPNEAVSTAYSGLNLPQGIALVGDYLYVCDSGNNQIKRIDLTNNTNDAITIIAGATLSATPSFDDKVDGIGSVATIYKPLDIVADPEGNLYVTDSWNCVRKIANDENWTVSTVAGNGSSNYADGVGANASFNAPVAMAMNSKGVLFITDTNHHRIRSLKMNYVDNYTDVFTSDAEYGAGDTLTLDGGTIKAGADNVNLSNPITLMSSSFVDVNGKITTLSGDISTNDPDAVLEFKNSSGSAGTVILENTSASGKMTVDNNVTLQVGNNDTGGALGSAVLNNGTLALNQSDSFSYAGIISGSGQVQINSGNVSLTGSNTYSGGTSVANNASLTMSAADQIGSDALTLSGGELIASGNFTLANDLYLTANSSIDATGQNLLITGQIHNLDGYTLNIIGGTVQYQPGGTGSMYTLSGTIDFKPDLSSLTDQVFTAGSSVDVPFAVTNHFSDSISYSINPALSNSLSLNSETGTISGTPAAVAASAAYTFTAAPEHFGSASKIIHLAVAAPMPIFSEASPINLQAGTNYDGTNAAAIQLPIVTNAYGDTITYALFNSDGVTSATLPGTLAFNSANAQITGESDAYCASTLYVLKATASTNPSHPATVNLYLSVLSAAPVFATEMNAQSILTGDSVSIQLPDVSNEATGDSVSYSVDGLPTGLSVDSATGLISGSVGALTVDTSANPVISYTATDSGGTTTSSNFTLNIHNHLAVDALSNQVFVAGSQITSITLSVHNAYNDAVTYHGFAGLPAGLSFEDGVLSGTPTGISANTAYSYSASTDHYGSTDSQNVNLQVIAPQPVFGSGSSALNLTSGVNYTANPIQLPIITNTYGDTITYALLNADASAAAELPAGLSFDDENVQITGSHTGYASSASYKLQAITASNPSNPSYFSFTLEVDSAAPQTEAPTLTDTQRYALNDPTILTGSAVSILLPDISNEALGDSVVYAITSGTLPGGLSLDSETGIISGTPTALSGENSDGIVNRELHYSITDSGGVVTGSFNLSVYNPLAWDGGSISSPAAVDFGSATITGSLPVLSGGSGSTHYVYKVFKSSNNHDFTIVPAISGAYTLSHGSLSLDLGNNSFTYTPAANFNGNDYFRFEADDAILNQSLAKDFTLTVNDPVLSFNSGNTGSSNANRIMFDYNDDNKTITLPGVLGGSGTYSYAINTDSDKGAATILSGVDYFDPDNHVYGDTCVVYNVTDEGITNPVTQQLTAYIHINTPSSLTVNPATSLSFDFASTPAALTIASVVEVPTADALELLNESASHGTLSLVQAENSATIKYAPNAGFYGVDTATFTVQDTTVDLSSSEQTINLTINAPVFTYGNSSFTTTADQASITEPFPSVSGGYGVYTYQSDDTNVSIDGSQFTYTLDNTVGAKSFSYTVSDESVNPANENTDPFTDATKQITVQVNAPAVSDRMPALISDHGNDSSYTSNVVNEVVSNVLTLSILDSATPGVADAISSITFGALENDYGDTVTYALTGTLPDGLSYDGETRVLSGAPTQAGSYELSYVITSATPASNSDHIDFTLNLLAPTPAFEDDSALTVQLGENDPVPTTFDALNFITGQDITIQLPRISNAYGASITYSLVIDDTSLNTVSDLANAGLEFDSDNATISGTLLSTEGLGNLLLLEYQAEDSDETIIAHNHQAFSIALFDPMQWSVLPSSSPISVSTTYDVASSAQALAVPQRGSNEYSFSILDENSSPVTATSVIDGHGLSQSTYTYALDHGTLTVTGQSPVLADYSFTYTPAAHDWTGNSFTYQVSDAQYTTATPLEQEYSVSVAHPVLTFTNTATSVGYDTAKSFSMPSVSGGLPPYTYTISTQPSDGVLTLNGNQAIFIPAAGSHGGRPFSYIVTDSSEPPYESDPQTFTITVADIDGTLVNNIVLTDPDFERIANGNNPVIQNSTNYSLDTLNLSENGEVDIIVTMAPSGVEEWSGTISGDDLSVVIGDGTTESDMTLSGLNTYSGGTTVNALATLEINSSNRVGTGAITLNGGTLKAKDRHVIRVDNDISVSATDSTIDTQSYTMVMVGALSTPSNANNVLNKVGSGSMILRNSAAYAGTLNIDEGRVIGDLSGADLVSIAANAIYDLEGVNRSLKVINGLGVIKSSLAPANLTLNIGANNYTTFSGTIDSSITQLVIASGKLMNGGTMNAGSVAINGIYDMNGSACTLLNVSGSGQIINSDALAELSLSFNGDKSFSGIIGSDNISMINISSADQTSHTLTLSGTVTAPMNVSNMTVVMDAETVAPSAITLNNSTLEASANAHPFAMPITVDGSSSISSSNGASFTGAITVENGTLSGDASGASSVQLNSDTIYDLEGNDHSLNNVSGSGTVKSSNGNANLSLTIAGSDTFEGTIDSSITQLEIVSGEFINAGTMNAGSVVIDNDATFTGDLSSAASVSVSGAYDLNGESRSISNLSGSGVVKDTANDAASVLTVQLSSDNLVFSGSIGAGISGIVLNAQAPMNFSFTGDVLSVPVTIGANVTAQFSNVPELVLNGGVAQVAASIILGQAMNLAANSIIDLNGHDVIIQGAITGEGVLSFINSSQSAGSVKFTGDIANAVQIVLADNVELVDAEGTQG